MARFAVVSLSELRGRMDASFHVALAEVRERVEELAATVSPVEAARRLDAIALKDKQVLRVLARGGRQESVGAATVEGLVAEYPHLALALVERNLAPAIERVRAEIARNQAALDALLAIASPEAVGPEEAPAAPRV